MFGLLYQSLERLLIYRFGEETWAEICEQVHLNEQDTTTDYTFCVHTQYDDKYALELVEAASYVLGIKQDVILEMFGEQFILFCNEAGYGKILSRLAPNLKEFLAALDTLHDHLTQTYPGMRPPSFTCHETEIGGPLIVNYFSMRNGLESVVVGIIKSISRDIFKSEVTVEIKQRMKPNSNCAARFVVTEKSKPRGSPKISSSLQIPTNDPSRSLISPKTFSAIFPFHFIMKSDMEIIQMGQALSRLLSRALISSDISHLTADAIFTVVKPKVKFKFDEIILYTHTVFVLQLHSSIKMRDVYAAGRYTFRLKGQMIFLPNSTSLAFLGSPRVTSMEEIQARGLYLSDFPIHDATRDLLMMMECYRAEMAMAIKMELLAENLRETKQKLEEEKQRAENLLHQMLPRQVAQELKEGKQVTAERFERVTILFSDIVNFVKMVGDCDPMQVVNMLNELYVKFDYSTLLHQVFKVETIGDAYMVVGGIPGREFDHAERVAKQAIDMRECAKTVKNISTTSEFVQIRIGMHSGNVVAAVVGKKMPRYCLFGQTVNITSRTESSGLPDCIHVTDEVYSELKDNPLFHLTSKSPVTFKGRTEATPCYWLEPGRYYPVFSDITTPMEIEIHSPNKEDNPLVGPNTFFPDSPIVNKCSKGSDRSTGSTSGYSYVSKISSRLSNIDRKRSSSQTRIDLDLPALREGVSRNNSTDNRVDLMSPLLTPLHLSLNRSLSNPNLNHLKHPANINNDKYLASKQYTFNIGTVYVNRGDGLFQPKQLIETEDTVL